MYVSARPAARMRSTRPDYRELRPESACVCECEVREGWGGMGWCGERGGWGGGGGRYADGERARAVPLPSCLRPRSPARTRKRRACPSRPFSCATRISPLLLFSLSQHARPPRTPHTHLSVKTLYQSNPSHPFSAPLTSPHALGRDRGGGGGGCQGGESGGWVGGPAPPPLSPVSECPSRPCPPRPYPADAPPGPPPSMADPKS